MRFPVIVAGVILLVLAAGAASAHRYHATFTTVNHNVRTGSIEVIHKIFSHDVELVLSQQMGRTVSLDSDGIEDILRAYLVSRFALYDKEGIEITLEWVGAEMDVNNIWVYLERPGADGLAGLSVRDDLMTDLYADQVNTVNLEQGGELNTLTFQREDGVQPGGF